MKVLILTEGGKNIGFGHITRCVALYQTFEERGITPEFIINGDNSVLDLLGHKNYHVINWLRKKNALLKMIDTAGSVVIDSYLAPKSLYDKIFQAFFGKLIMIDDFNRLEYPRGIVVNPSIYGDKLNYSNKNGATYLLGKDYIILRKEFWNVPKKEINKEVKNVLITFGAMNYFDLASKIINYLENRFDFHIYIVDTRKNRFTTKEMLSLMLKADICISGGGQTTNELARIGVPTIGICFVNNQLLNLREWARVGFLEFAGWCNDKNLFMNIEKSLKRLSYKKRIKMSQVGQRFVNGNGAIKLVDKVLEIISKK